MAARLGLCAAAWTLAFVAHLGCAPPMTGGVVHVPDSPYEDELMRCEATGRSREECYENHDVEPCVKEDPPEAWVPSF